MSTLKQQKEDFITGLLGGSVEEIYKITSVSLTSFLGFKLMKSGPQDMGFWFDFVLNCGALLASITIYSSLPGYLHMIVLIPCVLVYFWGRNLGKGTPASTSKSTQLLPQKPFLTAYRSHMILITNMAILAVDFKVFPRRFAKVETWGTSLMDLGVGSFVFSMGLVHSRSVIKLHNKKRVRFSLANYGSIIWKGIVKSLPLLALGAIRLVSVKLLEYQEHVTEYGIHWNFFITLGLLPILLGVLDPILNIMPRFLVAFAISGVYETLLNNTDLLKFILRSDNRMDSFITMNKEGIFSFIGYLSIFLFGQSFGSFVLTSRPTPYNLVMISSAPVPGSKKTKKSWFASMLTVSTTRGLVIASIFYQVIFLYFFQLTSISRRLANMPYVMWTVSYNAAYLLGYHLIDAALPNINSALLDSTNKNGLFLFLIGNLATGFINMMCNTLKVKDSIAFIILVVYILATCVVAVVLDKKGIYIKL